MAEEVTGRLTLDIEMTSAQAAELLKRLAWDNDFRATFRSSPQEALQEVGVTFHNELADTLMPDQELPELPSKKHFQEILLRLQYENPGKPPKPNPPMFGWCARMAIVAYAAAAVDTH